MAHKEQVDFCLSVKSIHPSYFVNRLVLDVGSLDINGNNQYLFEGCGYIGIDLLPGKNVDFAVKGHELCLPDASFDTVVSTECFEHDSFCSDTIKNIIRMLKPGGLFLFSCATTGRPEHGTRRTTPADAPFTQEFGEWADYYKNLDEKDIRQIVDVDEIFEAYSFSTNDVTCDLYFWGIKKGSCLIRHDYSFVLDHSERLRIQAELESQIEEGHIALCLERDRLSERMRIQTELESQIEAGHKALRLEHDRLEEALSKIALIENSRSWKLTQPLRSTVAFLRRLKKVIACFPLLEDGADINLQRAKKAFVYIKRGDFSGLLDRLASSRKHKSHLLIHNAVKKGNALKWGILTPGHTLFIGHLVSDRLNFHGWHTEIITKAPKSFPLDFYIVICPQIFTSLPPGEKRIVFQMEQSVSSRWFTNDYFKILENSLAVLEYSLINIDFLNKKGIIYPHVHYLPIGSSDTYGSHIDVGQEKFDVLFYGDSLSSPRRQRMLQALKEKFNVKLVSEVFGDDMIRILKQAKVIVNIHYYENALLEMPRIQECLSLGLRVVSETAQDQNDYPELGGSIIFFEEGSIEAMLVAVEQALNSTEQLSTKMLSASRSRFEFMFDRFLVATKFLPVSYVSNMRLPFTSNVNTFGLSLPETIERRRIFEQVCPDDSLVFDGIRFSPGWIGCGLSYSALARHALQHGLKKITVMEDDVILPADYHSLLKRINEFLDSKQGDWDIFAGVIASLHPDTHVLSVEKQDDLTFVTIDKMTSTVFNIYSENALKILSEWNPDHLDAATNTIDRYLESRKELSVVVLLPFFVGHREDVHSTLWGFKNTTYKEMIAESEQILKNKVRDFLTMQQTLSIE